ncbi:MAG TPA: hypothetical protein VIG51_10200 [Candidatus Baltobacteraceae bacterium]
MPDIASDIPNDELAAILAALAFAESDARPERPKAPAWVLADRFPELSIDEVRICSGKY